MKPNLLRRAPLLLLCFTLMGAVGCLSEPVTPVVVVQYPNTWTPAPTATDTPPPPTATLVIQRTAGPAPTADPLVRRLPTVPRTGIGVWLDADGIPADALALVAPRAQVIAANDLPTLPRNLNPLLLMQVEAGTEQAALASKSLDGRWGGLLVRGAAPADAAEYAKGYAALAPRLRVWQEPSGTDGGLQVMPQGYDGVCLCNFMRDADAPLDVPPTEAEWLTEVQALSALSADANRLVLTATRFPAETENLYVLQPWFNYALASFLLGANGAHTFFGFQGGAAQQFMADPALVAALGKPVGAMFKQSLVYQRRFVGGLVLANPTDVEHVVALPRAYQTTTGSQLSQVRMTPHSGLVLVNGE